MRSLNMLVSPLVALAVLGLGAHAQSDSEATTSAASTEASPATTSAPSESDESSTSSAGPQTITIAVGASGHRFTENEVTAEVGDTIEWIFYPANHSVIRAEYGYPCTPYEYIDIGREGFYSGPRPVAAITNDLPRYRVEVNDTEPIFYYCGAPGSCYQKHMIGVINPNSTFTLEGQQDALDGLTYQILPGEPFPGEDDAHPPGATGTPQPGSNDGGSSSGSNEGNDSGGGGGGSSLSAGAIAGIVIGGVAVLIMGAALIWFCGRRGGLDKAQRRETYQGPPPPVSEANYTVTPKSPGGDSRWSAAQWSMQHPPAEPYRDQHSPPAMMSHSPVPAGSHPAPGYGFVGNGMESQHNSYMSDPRVSQHGSPPPGVPYSPSHNQTAHGPVELPTPGNDGSTQSRTQ